MASSIELNFIKKFTGYKNYRDVTNLAPTDMTVGSQNVFAIDGVRIDIRGGSSFLGTEGTIGNTTNPSWTLAHRIHSHYDTFSNNQGITMPFRIYYSGSTAQGDVLEVWLPEYIAGIAQSTKKWYQVTANVPSTPIISSHKWYFAEWFDSLDDTNRLVFTYGTTTVSSYSGGFAPIVSFTGTTITTVAAWDTLGFINAPEGINTIVVNVSGVPLELAITSGDFTTNTITVASTAGLSVNDLCFQALNHDSIDVQDVGTGFNADVCGSLGNQVYYIDWKQRNVLISWAFNQQAFSTNIVYSGTSGLNDAVFTGTYTGTQTDTYQVYIDGIASENQTFTGTGTYSSYFDTSAYIGVGNNTYIVSIISNLTVAFDGGVVPAFINGEIIVGSTSGAEMRVTDLTATGAIFVNLLSGVPVVDETYTGNSSGVTSPQVASFTYFNEAYYFKNGVQVTGLAGMLPSGGIQLNPSGTFALNDGLLFVFPQVASNNVGDYYTLQINNADTYSWSLNGVNQASHVSMSLSPHLLGNGVSLNFQSIKGHIIGDNWTIVYYPTITRGWRQVYYTGYGNTQGTTPATNLGSIRLPGEGFKLQLDSNGWAMQPQVSSNGQGAMYINGQGGEFYEVTSKYSTNLQNQTFSTNRLRTEKQKKALYPYLMTTEPNYLSVVSAERTWDILGSQKFLQLPQIKTFSDQVRNDFQGANWLNSEQSYFDRKQWFVVPEQGQIFVYDDFMKYWHPPQSFGRVVGSLAIIDGQICGHSYERNETYQIFTNDLNDLGLYPIQTNITMAYTDLNKRYNKKTWQAIAFDGYMKGSPEINWTVNGGVGGCEFQETGTIKPIYCYPLDTSSYGKSGYGYHGLGNSPVNQPTSDYGYHGIETDQQTAIPHFMYGETRDEQNYYMRNIVLTCNSFEQLWSITSIGELTKYNLQSNSDIFNPGSQN
jgi:hypothetical protein